jgi:uncharacterized protein (TIGR02302 family)
LDGKNLPDLDNQPREQAATFLLLARALKRARGTIFWERLWPALVTLATALGIFLALSWAGLWLMLPPLGRAIGVFIFAVITAAATVPLLLLRLPTVYDGLRRLDRRSGMPHRPATAVADEIAASPSDPVTAALWRAHVERAILAARALKAGWPSPRIALRDPIALRALALILVVASFFAAGGERGKRIMAAFDWQGVISSANYRVDAWVNPPAYTARAPVMLSGLRPGEAVQQSAPVAVPAGSTLVVRATGRTNLDVLRKGGLEEAPADPQAHPPAGTEEHRYTIKSDGSATLRGVGSEDITWTFAAIPDRAPVITLTKEPEGQLRGSLLLAYKLDDDYGVTEAQAIFALKNEPGASASPRPLYAAPDYALVLPHTRTKNGVGQTTKDLTEHAWAGVNVAMTLVARDEAGNEGRSAPHEFQLPQRLFVKPIPRALIELRRMLALDADAKPRVLTALDALTLAPDRFEPDTRVYLGLRSIFWELTRARSDDDLREVVTRLWAMAVYLEDGNVSDAEQALRAAQEALRQALERGASEEEIKKLMEQLRAALDKFMQALAEEMRKNPQQLARPLDRNTRQLRPQDLKNMLDRLENLARSGNKDAARQLLEQLQQMLENLQMARPGQQDGDDGDDMMSSLDELGDMIRKQQQLRDRTFREGQDQRRDRQRGQRGQQGDQQMGELRQNQQALRDRLKKLLEELRQRGFGQQQPGQGQQGQAQQGQGNMDQLGDAGEAMGDAEGQLGQGNADGAVDSQGRALEAMRKGAQGLAQQMQQQGMGPGPGQPGRTGQARANQDTDPLGRPLRGRDYGDDVTVKVPGEIDVQRARRILEELRRRFGETTRPQLELDYLERLLKDF